MIGINVHTVSEFIDATATALEDRDELKLMALRSIAEDWLQPAEERQAQVRLVEVALDTIGELP